jgi:uncharacterized protein YgbK (DUF1537 family)
MSDTPLFSYYGDDFTGSTDALEALASQGVPTVLFLDIPNDRVLARFANCRAIGLAGESRSQSPQWMSEQLLRAFQWLQSRGAPICQYKVCSTFDSSPEIGNIGRALELGQDVFSSSWVPVVVGAPHLRRYVAFSNLFAAGDGAIHRIDRHPTMRCHPVTPMDESDLRRHLGRQTTRRIAALDIEALSAPDGASRLQRLLNESPSAVIFDGVDPASMRQTARLLWSYAAPRPTFAVGSSGLTHALIGYWQSEGLLQPPDPPARPASVDRVVVLSGSCSPVTARQIRHATGNGFAGIALDPANLSRESILTQALSLLREGRSVVLYSALGTEGVSDAISRHQLAVEMGRLLRDLIEQSGIRRAVIAGGDTASHAGRQLGVHALTLAAPLTPGSPLCRAHSDLPALDGVEFTFKGGQVGPDDFFESVLGKNS